MKTMILTTATVLAALLFAPTAYAYQCHPSGNEIRCITRDPYDLGHRKITVYGKNKIPLSYTYAISMAGCAENGRRIGALRLNLNGGHAASQDLSFPSLFAAFTNEKRTYKNQGKEACFEVVIYDCEVRTSPASAKISCDHVVTVTPRL